MQIVFVGKRSDEVAEEQLRADRIGPLRVIGTSSRLASSST